MRHTKLMAAGVLVIAALALLQIYRYTLGAKTVGTIGGPEREIIVMDGKTYVLDPSSGLSRADRGRFLGVASDGAITFRLYSVRGDGAERYIYRLWDWEGAFYKRTE